MSIINYPKDSQMSIINYPKDSLDLYFQNFIVNKHNFTRKDLEPTEVYHVQCECKSCGLQDKLGENWMEIMTGKSLPYNDPEMVIYPDINKVILKYTIFNRESDIVSNEEFDIVSNEEFDIVSNDSEESDIVSNEWKVPDGEWKVPDDEWKVPDEFLFSGEYALPEEFVTDDFIIVPHFTKTFTTDGAFRVKDLTNFPLIVEKMGGNSMDIKVRFDKNTLILHICCSFWSEIIHGVQTVDIPYNVTAHHPHSRLPKYRRTFSENNLSDCIPQTRTRFSKGFRDKLEPIPENLSLYMGLGFQPRLM